MNIKVDEKIEHHFARNWAGRIYGTNTGNASLQVKKSNGNFVGSLRFLDSAYGLAIYDVTLSLVGEDIEITGLPTDQSTAEVLSKLNATGRLNSHGEIEGQWETELGTGGMFRFFPHNTPEKELGSEISETEQLFTKRIPLSPIQISKQNLVDLGRSMEKDFLGSKVIVTVDQSTRHASVLSDFENREHAVSTAESVILFVQLPETGGLNRVLNIVFGSNENFILAQSVDASRAIGLAEKYRDEVRKFERVNWLRFEKFGVGLNQILLLAMIVFLPERQFERAFYVAGFVLVILSFSWAHKKYIPNAAIELSPSSSSAFGVLSARFLSWLFAIIATSVATLLTAKLSAILDVLGRLFAGTS